VRTPIPPHDIVRAVRAELAIPGRYHLHTAVVQKSWLVRLIDWVGDLYQKYIGAIISHIHVGPAGATIVGDMMIVIALGIVVYAGARLLISLNIADDRLGSGTLLPSRNAQALARTAAAFAEGGDFARAIRTLFSAAIVLLDLRGVVADNESATINQFRRALRNRASGAEVPFGEIARAYTIVAFAEEPIGEPLWTKAREAYAAIAETAA
jgi:hypothetical protein